MPERVEGPPRGGPFSSDPAAHSPLRRATRAVFLMIGVGIAAWAPLVPDAKARLGLDEAMLGSLLLAVGAGALAVLPVAGMLVHRLGPRRVILGAGLPFCALPVLLALAPSPAILAALLAVLGATMAAVDIAMNVQAVAAERAKGRPLMSGFHGVYSLGGLAGAGGMAGLLALGFAPAWSAALLGGLLASVLLAHAGALLPRSSEPPAPGLKLPRGRLAAIGALCAIAFLLEGAVLDWSGVFIRFVLGADPSLAGLGFAALSLAMTGARVVGDGVVRRFGPVRVLRVGAVLAGLGFAMASLAPSLILFLPGCALIGLGVANMVPVLLGAAARVPGLPPGHAIAAAATPGYAGLLAGPAAVGWLAAASSLPLSFAALAVLALLVGLLARRTLQG